MVGRMGRLFLTVPTKDLSINKFYNVHFLLDTGVPTTQITRRTVCALNHIEYDNENKYDQKLPFHKPYQIAGKKIWPDYSNVIQ